MNTAKEEALQMLKNNSIKADETLKGTVERQKSGVIF